MSPLVGMEKEGMGREAFEARSLRVGITGELWDVIAQPCGS